MFELEKKKYITRGIKEKVSMFQQLICWNLIKHKRESNIKLDYLQIFEFSQDNNCSKVIHRQEQPLFIDEYSFKKGVVKQLRIWVIDDGGQIVMLLPEEY
ncbi:MAG: DUF960 family protein [Liquorilactobacillus sp.]|uniref:DUF960 family protein n=1 Tax=Liquorilactobacillus sp. TaxID=2767923 RepID=UPI0039EAE463